MSVYAVEWTALVALLLWFIVKFQLQLGRQPAVNKLRVGACPTVPSGWATVHHGIL